MKSKSVNVLVIHLTQSFLPGGGGLESTINQVIKALDYENSEVLCIANSPKEVYEQFDKVNQVKVTRKDSLIYYKASKLSQHFNSVVSGGGKLTVTGKLAMLAIGLSASMALFLLGIKRIIHSKEQKIVIHSYSIASLFIAITLKKVFFLKKIYVIFNNQFIYSKSGFLPVDLVFSYCLKNTYHIFCVSSKSVDEITKSFRLDSSKINRLYNWMDTSNMPDPKISTHNFVEALFVGRVVPEKGIEIIIQLARLISEEKLPIKINVVGNSLHPIQNELITEAKNNTSLYFSGRLEGDALWSAYNKGDIFLMPNLWDEGFGKVILEASYYGLPVIAPSTGALPEVLSYFEGSEELRQVDAKHLLKAINKIVDNGILKFKSERIKHNDLVINETFSSKNINVVKSVYRGIGINIENT